MRRRLRGAWPCGGSHHGCSGGRCRGRGLRARSANDSSWRFATPPPRRAPATVAAPASLEPRREERLDLLAAAGLDETAAHPLVGDDEQRRHAVDTEALDEVAALVG